MRLIFLSFAACTLLFASCNNSATTSTPANDNANTVKEPAKSKLNEEGTKMLLGVVTNYYALKNAMVAAKATDATAAAAQLTTAAESLGTWLQKDSANMAALKPFTDTVIAQSKAIAAITDPSCEKQRIVFDTISTAMYGLLKKAELKNAGVYHEFCPMAFNDRGATWLSEESEIKNPYFGKKMLECGEVTDSL